jgi:hypothetical protein
MSKLKLGFAVSALHAYLGHFKNESVLRKGHNVTPEERIAEDLRKRNEAIKRATEALPGRDETLGVSPHDRRGPKFGVAEPEKPKR